MPRISQITEAGSGKATSAMKSSSPFGNARSSRPVTMASTRGPICSASRGVKTFMISPRIRVCFGGSVKPSQFETWLPSGHICVRSGSGMAFMFSEIRSEDRRGSRNPAITSSWRVMSQPLIGSHQCTGSSRRSRWNSGYGSASRPAQYCR